MNLRAQIESILFYKADVLSWDELSALLDVPKEDIKNALDDLEHSLEGHGLVLIRQGQTVTLGTHPDIYPIISELQKKELKEPLSKASLETLSIILYEGPIAKSHIDHIRGVNSSLILRNLRSRGLVEVNDVGMYQATADTLSHLGIRSLDELPEYKKIREHIKEQSNFDES